MLKKTSNKSSKVFTGLVFSSQNSKKLSNMTSSIKSKQDLSKGTSCMTSSIKKLRQESSTSSKKADIKGSSSNKSLKQNYHMVKSVSNNPNVMAHKNYEQGKQKKGAIVIKNIKNKIVGNNGLNSLLSSKDNGGISQDHTSIKNQNITYIKNVQTVNTPKSYSSHNLNKNSFRRRSQETEGQKNKLNLNMFEVGRKLGKGRFGDVYMARQKLTGFALALKIINKKQLKESDMQNQLIQEIKIQLFSNHPNLLKMYGFFADQKKIYLMLELATNGCLFREIRKNKCFSENDASYYFKQVVGGIRYLHSHEVIHRDIKPENILNSFSVLKICDFGWAVYSPIYQRQTFCGTLDYVPPEIVTGQFYDEKVDIWCLGVLCYELCTGHAPFESKTDENETYNKILNVSLKFPSYLSGQLVDFINKILTRNPHERLALQQWQKHEWMIKNEKQKTGRMISKQIWDTWVQLVK